MSTESYSVEAKQAAREVRQRIMKDLKAGRFGSNDRHVVPKPNGGWGVKKTGGQHSRTRGSAEDKK